MPDKIDKIVKLNKALKLPNKGLVELKNEIDITKYNVLVQDKKEGKTYLLDSSELNSGGGDSGLESIVAGDNITIDDTDPQNPIISATGTGGGGGSPAGSDTQIQYNNAGAFGASSDFTRSDTLYNSVVRTVETPKNPTFSGSGLNDLSFSGTFTGENTTTYTITIASTGMLDTYDWTDGPNSGYGSNCNTSPGLLSNGVYIEFTNNIGHTIGDSWTFTFGVSKSVIKQAVYESDFYSLTEDSKLFGFRTNQDGTVTVGNFSSGSAIKLLIDDTAKTAVLGNIYGGNNTAITVNDTTGDITLKSNSAVIIGSITGGNGTKITIDDVNEHITISNLPAFDDDAAAGTGGLTAGMVYMTTGSGVAPLNTAGILMIKQ